MTTRSPNLREKYLDGEKLFRKYFEMGESRSINLLTEWAITEGMTSSTGQEPTDMGIWKAMWRWASLKENKDVAWKIAFQHGGCTNPDEWEKEMVNIKIPSAWQHSTRAKRERFMRENGWINGSKS
jgi:hypothetical protein